MVTSCMRAHLGDELSCWGYSGWDSKLVEDEAPPQIMVIPPIVGQLLVASLIVFFSLASFA